MRVRQLRNPLRVDERCNFDVFQPGRDQQFDEFRLLLCWNVLRFVLQSVSRPNFNDPYIHGPILHCAPSASSAIFRDTMLKRVLPLLIFLALSAFAQEGHPLTGTWSGDWGVNATQRTHLTF